MADLKITELGENTTPLLTDVIAIVDDPGVTPVTEKIKLENIKKVVFNVLEVQVFS